MGGGVCDVAISIPPKHIGHISFQICKYGEGKIVCMEGVCRVHAVALCTLDLRILHSLCGVPVEFYTNMKTNDLRFLDTIHVDTMTMESKVYNILSMQKMDEF